MTEGADRQSNRKQAGAAPPRFRRGAAGPINACIASVLVALTMALAGVARPARAQFLSPQGDTGRQAENIEGLTVAGKGSVAAKPDHFEIELEVSAASELTADAIVKYRDARRRITDAFAALKLDNVAVEERGLLIDQKGMANPYYFGGFQQNTRTKTEVQLTRKLVVKGSKIRAMEEEALLQLVAKLLDVAQDAGGRVGGPPGGMRYSPFYGYYQGGSELVRFVLDDYDKLREEAYDKAVADARSRAERLARLGHLELGPIVSVREVSVPGEHGPAQVPSPMAEPEDESSRGRLESPKFQKIPVRVELLVRFEVRPRSEGKERAAER